MINTSEIPSKRGTFTETKDGFVPLKVVAELLESIKKRTFESGIPRANETKNNQFEKMFFEEKEGISFNPLNEKRINSEDLYPGILIQKEDRIKSNGLKATHRYPYATNLYGRNGEYIGGIRRGDE